MIRLAVLFFMFLSVPASAFMGNVPIYVMPSGGGGGCTNKLDFSVACNSQYIPVIMP